MKKYLRYLGHILIFAIFILAIYLLYRKLQAYSIGDIKNSMQLISGWRIVLSIFLMIINYMILVGYDWLAIKAINKKLSLARVALVSFVGQAVSYNFGALLGGTTVRYRFYSAWDFSISEILRLVLMLAVTFWVGALGLCGIIFMLVPPVIPDALAQNMPFQDIRILGLILTLVASSYLVLCFSIRKPVLIFGKEFVFPSPRIAICQCIVAGVDIVAAAACMYALLPSEIGVSFIDFLPGYLMAQVAVVLTHIPGGVGVFELVILELTHTTQEQMVFAAVLLFRLIYYILPLLAAAAIIVVYETRQKKDILSYTGRWLSVLSHSISACLTFVGGIVLLASASLPLFFNSPPEFMQNISEYFITIGRVICALSGTALIFLSYGLERRQYLSFKLTVTFIILGICGTLLDAFSWITASFIIFVFFAVYISKRGFYRASFFMMEKYPLGWLFAGIGSICIIFILSWFFNNPSFNNLEKLEIVGEVDRMRVLFSFFSVCAFLLVGLLWHFWHIKHIPQKKK